MEEVSINKRLVERRIFYKAKMRFTVAFEE